MTFRLTDAQTRLAADARRFGEAVVGDDLTARDRRGAVDPADWRGLWRACGAHGLLGCHVPTAYGGAGHDIVSAVAMLEGFGRGCRDNGLSLAVNGQVWSVTELILAFGTEAQRARWLPGLCSGALTGAHGTTEADTGSDALAARTRAERRDGGYLLNGAKVYSGLGPDCDLAVVLASVEPAHGAWGLASFVVEAGDAGFERGPPQMKMGLRTTPMGELQLRDCWVPEDRRLGAEGDGAAIFQHAMEWERCFIFASHIGAMARQLDDALGFARRREVFGRAIAGHQSVSNRLADMRVRLETSRLMIYHAAALKAQDEPCALEAAMIKLHVSEAYAASSLDAIRVHGGIGYMEDAGVERELRDALGGLIYSGTSDIQRQVIASLLGGDQ